MNVGPHWLDIPEKKCHITSMTELWNSVWRCTPSRSDDIHVQRFIPILEPDVVRPVPFEVALRALILSMPREMPPAATRELARQLLIVTGVDTASQHDNGLQNVLERLREAITKFAGADSFNAILRRSLTLARVEFPATLEGIAVGADGRLEGLSASVGACESAALEAAAAIVATLLWLLATFIGMPLTIRLINDAWPAESLVLHPTNAEEEP